MRKMFKRWLPYIAITLFFVVAGCLAYWHQVAFLELMELKTVDLRFRARGAVAPGPEVVLAVVDEKSIDREGKWVWPRVKFARLIDKLSAAETAVIAFDVGFLEPGDKILLKTIAEIKNKARDLKIDKAEIYAHLEDVKKLNDNDRLLAEAIINSKAEVVLGYFFQFDAAETKHVTKVDIQQHKSNVGHSRFETQYVTEPAKGAEKAGVMTAIHPQSNIAAISGEAQYSGYFNMLPDWDGVVRRLDAVVRFENEFYAPLSLMALGAYLQSPPTLLLAESQIAGFAIGDYYIPSDEFGRIFINYRGPQKTFAHISITDILHDKAPAEVLKEAIVFVGATATGIYDLRTTPMGSVYPGLEIHANVADSILAGDFLQQPAWGQMFDLLAIIVAGFLLGLVLPRTGALTGAGVSLVLFAGHMTLCQYLFGQKGWILNLVYPLTVILLTYIAITAYRYLLENRQKRFIKDAFATYLAPSVVKQLVDSGQPVELGGEEREITAFFSDVQGFTSISEKLTPSELVELLNEFLTEMTDIILKHDGTVDKFEGDAIIAFFGAPNILPDHALQASLATIEMQKKLAEMREGWAQNKRPLLHMRVGLCSGPAVVGNMGSKSRMDYTMMGDTVNTAARLEGVNKIYGIYTLIGAETFKGLDESIATREIDAINVVGKSEPVKVYQILGFATEIDETLKNICTHYTEGLAAYREQKWDMAMDAFNSVLALCPEDGPSQTMLARCETYKNEPPPDGWNGSYTMTHK